MQLFIFFNIQEIRDRFLSIVRLIGDLMTQDTCIHDMQIFTSCKDLSNESEIVILSAHFM